MTITTRLLKRYTAHDITRMRDACKGMIYAREWTGLHDHLHERVELTLRTYMDNGTTPAELEAELKRIKEEERPKVEAYFKRREEELQRDAAYSTIPGATP
jgi:hypothetical protein